MGQPPMHAQAMAHQMMYYPQQQLVQSPGALGPNQETGFVKPAEPAKQPLVKEVVEMPAKQAPDAYGAFNNVQGQVHQPKGHQVQHPEMKQR